MAFDIPPSIFALAKTYDLLQGPLVQDATVNLFLRDLEPLAPPQKGIKGYVENVPRRHSVYLLSDQEKEKPFLPTEQIVVRFTSDQDQLIDHCDLVYLHGFKVTSKSPPVLQQTQQSLILTQGDQAKPKWDVEQFAGGYGGWQFAHRLLHREGLTDCPTLSIEHNLNSAVQYALNHGASIVGDVASVPQDFLQQHAQDVILVCDVADRTWQQLLQHASCRIWTLSSPCQPWSLAGLQEGFSCANGEALAHAVTQIRIFQPDVVAIEQVSGFCKHPHYGVFQRLMHWAGYNQIHQGVFELANITPVRRARWLAVYVSSQTVVPLREFPWPLIPADALHFDIFFPLADDIIESLTPTVTTAAKYFDAQLAPGKNKHLAQSDLLRIRIPDLLQKLPTVMYQYGNAHNLNTDHLKKGGLFGHFVRQGAIFRFWGPFELVLMHIQVDAVVLPKPNQAGWQSIGNCISTPQAAYCLAHAAQAIGLLSREFDIHAFVKRIHQDRLKASQVELLEDDQAYYVGYPLEVEHLQDRLNFFLAQMHWQSDQPFRWPAGKFFSCTKGLLDMTTPHEQVTEISPTQPVQIMFPLQVCLIPGEYGTYQCEEQVTWTQLLALWKLALQPHFPLSKTELGQTLSATVPSDRVMLLPTDDWGIQDIPHDPTHTLVCIRRSWTLELYEVHTSEPWETIRQKHNLSSSMSDVWGVIESNQTFQVPTELAEHEPEVPVQPALSQVFQDLASLDLTCWVPPNTDILAIECTGNPTAFTAFQTCWLSQDMKEWYRLRGRQVNLLIMNENTWRVLLRPLPGTTATPVKMLRYQMFIRMLHTCLFALQDPAGIPVAIKYDRKTPSVPLPADLSFATLFHFINHCSFLIEPVKQLRIVTAGKQCSVHHTVHEIAALFRDPQRVVFHLVHPLLGGGGAAEDTKGLTSKQQYHKMIEGGLASLLLDYGINLPAIAKCVTALIETHGMQKLNRLLHAESNKHQVFRDLCSKADVSLPSQPTMQFVKGRHQKMKDRKVAKTSLTVDPNQYALKEGFFLNADGSKATILTSYTPGASGVYLMDPQTAHDWVTSAAGPTLDELGLYVVGTLRVPEKFQVTRLHAPAIDSQGREVLLNGQLIQLGSRLITTIASAAATIETKAVQIASITVWKSDWDAPLWDKIQHSPVKELKEILRLEGNGDLVGKPWGRAYRDGGISVNPDQASSIQFHCEMTSGPQLTRCLQRSGFNGIYITPKTIDGAIAQGYRMIWLEGNPKQLESRSIGIPGVAGLVKGKKGYGLRIEDSSFKHAWEKLKPGIAAPNHTPTSMLFKLQPLPVGTDAEILVQWASQAGWAVRPVKALGAKQWLVGSNDSPPPLLCFNSQPILVQPQKSGPSQHAIAAGPSLPGKPSSTKSNEVPHRQGDPHYDPWAPAAKALQPTARASMDPSKDTGPVAEMFQQQSDRIKAIEDAVTTMQEQHVKTAEAMDTRYQGLQEALSSHVQATTKNIEYLHTEHKQLHQTLHGAIQKQEERLVTSFEELKNIFLSTRGMKRTTDDAAEAVLTMQD
eukprot:Skav229651  [mRNA]  locus=scaffold649:392999:397600:- [translate_table: standard]